MAAQYELLKELLNSGTKLSFGQDFFFKFYQAFLLKDRWMQYINGVGTTLLVTALALALGVVLGSVVALVRVTHDQQRPGHKNAVLGFFNAVCQVYTTIIRGTPMMVQLPTPLSHAARVMFASAMPVSVARSPGMAVSCTTAA